MELIAPVVFEFDPELPALPPPPPKVGSWPSPITYLFANLLLRKGERPSSNDFTRTDALPLGLVLNKRPLWLKLARIIRFLRSASLAYKASFW